MKKLKCNWRLFALGLISIVAGILFCAIPTDKLIKITFYVIGALVIVNGCISLYHSIKAKDKLSILFDIVDIAFGICLIFFHQTFMLIIIAVYLIVLPIVRIILNPMPWGFFDCMASAQRIYQSASLLMIVRACSLPA